MFGYLVFGEGLEASGFEVHEGHSNERFRRESERVREGVRERDRD